MKQLAAVFVLLILCSGIVNAQIISAGSGNWNDGGTWVGGVVPGPSDNVVIANGHAVAINATVTVASLTVGQGTSGTLTFDAAAARTVTVTGDVTVAAGGSFVVPTPIVTTGDLNSTTSVTNVGSTAGIVVGMPISASMGIPQGTTVSAIGAGTLTLSQAATATSSGITLAIGYNHSLLIGGNLTNDGTFDLSLGYGAGLCTVTFNNVGNQTISGSGTLTRCGQIRLDKGAVGNKISSTITVQTRDSVVVFVAGTWEQSAGRLIAPSGSVQVGSALTQAAALNIIGTGGLSIGSAINVYGSFLVNTTDSVFAGTSTGGGKIDLTNYAGNTGTFTKGTVKVFGKFVSSSIGPTTINGADIILDPKDITVNDYVFRTTTGGGTIPFTFSSGTVTFLNPNPVAGTKQDIQLNSSIAPAISGGAFIFGQGASTVAGAKGYLIAINAATKLNDVVFNTGNVSVTLQNTITFNGTVANANKDTLIGGLLKGDKFVFNGTAAQMTGRQMPDTVKNVTINNAAGVTASKTLSISDTLFLVSGTLSGPYTARVTVGSTDVPGQPNGIPLRFVVAQNYPNPFNPSTTISFSLDKAGFTSLRVYDILGRLVGTVIEGVLPAGPHQAVWNASGRSSGIYFYTLQSGDKIQTRKMALLK